MTFLSDKTENYRKITEDMPYHSSRTWVSYSSRAEEWVFLHSDDKTELIKRDTYSSVYEMGSPVLHQELVSHLGLHYFSFLIE